MRPHEALGGRRPGEVHSPSERRYTGAVERMEYPPHFDVGSVHSREYRWRGHRIRVSHALNGEHVGLEPVDERYWDVSFGPVVLGTLDTQKATILKHKQVTLSETWLEWVGQDRT